MNESSDEADVNVASDIDCEEVVTFVENDICTYKINLIVCSRLITKKFRNSLDKFTKALNTSITFETKENNSIITISGENRDQVIETKMKLTQILVSVRKQIPFTHLITVPFNNQVMREEFSKFKDYVLNNFKDCRGIDEHLFQNPDKLHLTFCVLVLLNEEEILKAKQLLRTSLDQVVKPLLNDKPLRVTVEGLNVMKSNPDKANVLYAQVNDPLDHFQAIADGIVRQFVESGILEKQKNGEDKVKLHVTFMNSLFRQRIISRSLESHKKSKRVKRETFDAKKIVDHYRFHKFSDMIIENIQLNNIKTKTESGFYGLTEMIELPQE